MLRETGRWAGRRGGIGERISQMECQGGVTFPEQQPGHPASLYI